MNSKERDPLFREIDQLRKYIDHTSHIPAEHRTSDMNKKLRVARRIFLGIPPTSSHNNRDRYLKWVSEDGNKVGKHA